MEEELTLTSQDGQEFRIRAKAAEMSKTVQNLLKDADAALPIPLPNVTGALLEKVVKYCNYHFDHPNVESAEKGTDTRSDAVRAWDTDFCKMDKAVLFEMILAANYMDIPSLLDLLCQDVADSLVGKTPEEIRKEFNILNDFTPEEEEQVRKENSWCEPEK